MSMYSEAISSLFSKWRAKPEIDSGDIHITRNFFIEDGIVDEDAWRKVPQGKRILFALKDVNDENCASDWTIQELLNHDAKEKMWRRTAEWVRGIMLTELNGPTAPYDEFPKGNGTYDWLKKVAIINLKKAPGKGNADMVEISEYAKTDASEIRREIALIDPDVIICGGTKDAFYAACGISDKMALTVNYSHGYSRIEVCGRPRLVINYYHPANQYPRVLNYYGIVGIYHHALVNGACEK